MANRDANVHCKYILQININKKNYSDSVTAVTWRRKMRMDQIQLQREHDCVEHGNLRDGQGMFDKAIAAYDIALKIDPEDADALFDKGITLKKMGNHAEGNKLIDEAVQLYMR